MHLENFYSHRYAFTLKSIAPDVTSIITRCNYQLQWLLIPLDFSPSISAGKNLASRNPKYTTTLVIKPIFFDDASIKEY